MCTAVSFKTKDHYFGRNLDLEYAYNEEVTVTPRNFPLHFREAKTFRNHFAIIGMATIAEDYPLYYDATNERGLSVAGLNFPGNAVYLPPIDGKDNITPFEFIPWILCQCQTVAQARKLLERINLTNTPFSEEYPLSPLHWIISDKTESIVIEPMQFGISVLDNPIGVLTNNPPFEYHMHNLCNYLNLTREEPVNRFSEKIDLSAYSRGMGSIGLPGDLSSGSRFVKATFTKLNSICGEDENSSVSQFFHILTSVEQQRGCVRINNAFEITLYSSCCNTDKGIYYFTTYENRQISAVHLYRNNLCSNALISYPISQAQAIRHIN